jgi:hypothetical protein
VTEVIVTQTETQIITREIQGPEGPSLNAQLEDVTALESLESGDFIPVVRDGTLYKIPASLLGNVSSGGGSYTPTLNYSDNRNSQYIGAM